VNPAALDAPELNDPDIRAVVALLTSGPTRQELAGQDAALAMFRAEQPGQQAGPAAAATGLGRHRQARRRIRLSHRLAAAASAVVAAGFVSAGYAAVLPAPLQHAAYRILGFVGMPDSHGRARPHASHPPATGQVSPPASGSGSTAPVQSRSPGPHRSSAGRAQGSPAAGSHGNPRPCQHGMCKPGHRSSRHNHGKHKRRRPHRLPKRLRRLA
jgi:hypothetical protein